VKALLKPWTLIKDARLVNQVNYIEMLTAQSAPAGDRAEALIRNWL